MEINSGSDMPGGGINVRSHARPSAQRLSEGGSYSQRAGCFVGGRALMPEASQGVAGGRAKRYHRKPEPLLDSTPGGCARDNVLGCILFHP